jgi:dethiobiotin synthetase
MSYMFKGIFVTGTDTGVGKTYLASGIAAELRHSEVNVGVMKPAETGCSMRGGRLVPSDARCLMKAAGVDDPLALVNPYRFRRPLAPSVAARLAGKNIDPDEIVVAYRELARRHDFMIVEGAGGIMVPLRGAYTYLDLALALALPVLIVARPGLGTINHTLLTIAALKERRLAISGIVINHLREQKFGLAEKTNPAVLERISGVKILGTVTYGSCRFGPIVESLK